MRAVLHDRGRTTQCGTRSITISINILVERPVTVHKRVVVCCRMWRFLGGRLAAPPSAREAAKQVTAFPTFDATNIIKLWGEDRKAAASTHEPTHIFLKMPSEKETTPPHISINGDDAEGHDAGKGSPTPKSSSGWDGKLRVEKKLELANPEALSDPEYSDEDQVLPGEQIDADEGIVSPSYRM